MITSLFFCAEGISQAGMPAFHFGAARECGKLAKLVSHHCAEGISQAGKEIKKRFGSYIVPKAFCGEL